MGNKFKKPKTKLDSPICCSCSCSDETPSIDSSPEPSYTQLTDDLSEVNVSFANNSQGKDTRYVASLTCTEVCFKEWCACIGKSTC